MRIERRDGAIWVVSRFSAPGATAITLGPVVLIRERGLRSARLRRHELVHVRQWRELGVDRKSTRLNSSHVKISYAVFCLKKQNIPPSTPPSRVAGRR